MEIKVMYGVISVISMLLIIGYCQLIKKREVWFLLLYISVFVVNVGYFALSVSGTLEKALIANRLAYLGSVFLPLCMLMSIMNVCKIRIRRGLVCVLLCISAVVFLIAASGGYTDWYYKEVTLTFVNGAAKLLKTYGSLHNVYYIYLFSCFALMAAVIGYAVVKKKVFEYKHAALLACVVLGNIAIWFIEQRIEVYFEFLSISYIVSELVLLFVYGLLQDYERIEHKTVELENEMKLLTEEHKSDLNNVLQQCVEAQGLTEREAEVLRLIIEDKRRKDIAEELGVTEHTIKKHTSHIFSKMDVTSRKELYQKIGYRP